MSDRPGPSAPAAIEVDGLVKAYGGRRVVDGVTFAVAPGEVVALLGPNGAGKTTTVEIVEGYRPADGGRVRVLGADPAGAGRDHRARVGLMLQGGGGIDPWMSPLEVLRLHAAFHARPRDPDELLDVVGLSGAARTRFRRLSGGERQRLGLALALVGRPEVVVLDEPTAGLDVEARSTVRALVGGLREEGIAVLVTSHDLGDVERVADRIVIVDRGRVVAAGRPDELGEETAEGLRLHLVPALSEADRASLEAHLAAGAILAEGAGRYRIAAPATPALVAGVTAWCADRGILVAELRAGGGTLEERYVALLGAAEGGT